MTFPAVLFAIRWLIRDTFRQSLANGTFWLMLGVSALCIAFCLTISTPGLPLDDGKTEYLPRSEVEKLPPEKLQGSGISVIEGELTLAFGAIRVEWNRVRNNAVRSVQLAILGLAGGTGGILLALIWTAGFLPTFLDPGSVTVLLAKPTPRWLLLAGKYLGVLAFVAFHAAVLVLGVWLALGIKTGVWDATCLLALPILLLHFAVFFSFSLLLAVTTRSTVACVFGSILFWLACFAMNLGRHAVFTVPELQNLSPLFNFLADAGYWILPKPADFGALLVDALQAQGELGRDFDVKALEAKGAWHPGLSVCASVAFAVLTLVMAAYEFVTLDY